MSMRDWPNDAIRAVRIGWVNIKTHEAILIVELCDEVLRLREKEKP